MKRYYSNDVVKIQETQYNHELHSIKLDNNRFYTTEELADIADTIKSYAQDADLIEKLY
jgi:hypothetical protein